MPRPLGSNPSRPLPVAGNETTTPVKGPATPAAPAAKAPVGLEPSSPDLRKLTGAPSNARPTKSLSAVFDSLPSKGAGPAKARILAENPDAWNARWDLLTHATKSIDTQYFILEKDIYGFAFLGALLKKQLDGVPVRLMTDAMADTFGKNGFKLPLRGQDYLQELVDHGAKAWIYHPISSRLGEVFKGDYSVLASNHDKILAVDGKAGITGGRNIAADYFAEPIDHPGAWRDMDISLEGEGAAKGLVAAFDAEIQPGGPAKPVSKDFLGNWSKKDIQLIGSYVMMDEWLKAPAFTAAEKEALRKDPSLKKPYVDAIMNKTLARVQTELPEKLRREPSDHDKEFLTKMATQLVDQLEMRGSQASFHAGAAKMTHDSQATILDQTSAAKTRINGIAPELTAMVDAAKSKIVIQNPYVVLTEDMIEALERAGKRGVQIDIVTNSPLSTDSDVTQAFFLEDWAYILARVPDSRIFVATGDRKFHGKSAVVDGEDCFVSSYNLDLLSGYVNSEVGALVKGEETAKDLLADYKDDLSNAKYGFIEYKIQKDENGKAIVKDGKPVPAFGPEDHLPQKIIEEYKPKRERWGHLLRNLLPQFKPLRHPPLPNNP
jgi:putative cardiolipin synthase